MWNYSRIRKLPNLLCLILILIAVSCQFINLGDSEKTPLLDDKLITGPESTSGFNIILGTSDLAIGPNRFTFAIISPDGLVNVPSVKLKSMFNGDIKQSTKAHFELWPIPQRGLYVTELYFDESGIWDVEIELNNVISNKEVVVIQFKVKDSFVAPAKGDFAFKSVNKTIEDVNALSQLTTGSLQDPDFYRMTISEVIFQGKPFVLVFSSPAFCTNAVCGPQLEVLHSLKTKHEGRYIFIHVDIYDNPEQVQSNFENARISPVVNEWNLPTSLWTFIVDGKGKIKYRFEAFASESEIENALNEIL